MVLPEFNRLAQSKPTAAFLLVLTLIEPLSLWPPLMRKLREPVSLIDRIRLPRTSLMRPIISRLTFCLPFSMRLMADCDVLSMLPSWLWVMPFSIRALLMIEPISAR